MKYHDKLNIVSVGFAFFLLLSVMFLAIFSGVEDVVSRQCTTYISLMNRFVLNAFLFYHFVSITVAGCFGLLLISIIWIERKEKNE